MAILESEAELWVPDFFKTPPPDVVVAIEHLRRREELGVLNRALSPGSDGGGSVAEERRARDGYDAYRRIPPESPDGASDMARKVAHLLLDVITNYGEQNPNPNGAQFYYASIRNRFGSGQAITELSTRKPNGTEHMSSEAFVEEMFRHQAKAVKARGITDRATATAPWPIEKLVKFKVYSPGYELPILGHERDRRPQRDAPFEGGVNTDGPFFFGTYRITAEAGYPIPVRITEERLEGMLRFAKQFGEMALSESEDQRY